MRLKGNRSPSHTHRAIIRRERQSYGSPGFSGTIYRACPGDRHRVRARGTTALEAYLEVQVFSFSVLARDCGSVCVTLCVVSGIV